MSISYEGADYELEAGETVLTCLERNGADVASLCRTGACQTCMLKATAGAVPAAAQSGLKPAWKKQGLFLACLCKPTANLSIEPADVAQSYQAQVQRVERVRGSVLKLWMKRPADFKFDAGQFVQLIRPSDGLMRPYSIASLPNNEELEFHIAVLPDGKMSSWLTEAAGQTIEIRGPFGECIYVPDSPGRPLLLVGTGTGLAPLLGVLRAALGAGHSGMIRLLHGAKTSDGLYMDSELAELESSSPNLQVLGSVLEGPSASAITTIQRSLEELALENKEDCQQQIAYLCGNPDLVQRLKMKLYLAGTPLSQILSDPFAPQRAAPS